MRFNFLLILILLPFIFLGQYNHVRNPNFEDIYTGYNCAINCPVNVYNKQIQYWQKGWPWTIPKLTGLFEVGSPDLSCENGPIGEHWGHAGHYEYMVQELDKPLEYGKYYYLSFLFAGTPKQNLGMRFYKERPKQKNTTTVIKDDGAAHLDELEYESTGIITTPSYGEWRRARKYWQADGNYSYLVLGAFDGADGTLQIDGVRVIEVGSSDCPEWNLIENTTFTDDMHLVYRSSHVTGAGNSIDNNQTDGIVTIAAQSTVTLKSSNLVVMENGFYVPEGGTLHAYIAPCDADCFPPVANAGSDKVICDGTAAGATISNQLGAPATFNPDVSYQWTSIPASAINYLSCTDCPNPIIIANSSGAYSTVQYQLTVTNACGQKATDNVKIVFDLNAFLYNPAVVASNINQDNYIDFDITYNSHTEWIKIDVYNNSNNNIVYSKQLNRGDDFSTSPIHWEIDQYLKVCDDYTVKVYSKNFCNETLSAVQIIPWVRDKNVVIGALPNVFTPPNPPSGSLCYNATGVDEYEILVKDASGVTIYSKNGDYPANGCLWDGSCNGSQTNCSNNNAPNGTYFIVVKFKNCLNSVEKAHFVQLFKDIYKIANPESVTDNTNETRLFPNPTSAVFTIIPSYLMVHNYTVEITDNMNKRIYTAVNQNEQNMRIDLSSFGKGIYYVRLYNETENYFNKLIVN